MSKHSKNNTSSTIFTYAERQKLKGTYGTIENRIGQDSIKRFQMCTICNNHLIQPTCCEEGHMFCRPCIIQYMVKQKSMIANKNSETQKQLQRQQLAEREKQMEEKLQQLEDFQKYDGFMQVTNRASLIKKEVEKGESSEISEKKDIKPIGIYELNNSKSKYVKSSFWAIQNTPQLNQKLKKEEKIVYCPGRNHKIHLKKLRDVKCKQIEEQFACWICSKEIKRQKIGAYKCGHLLCQGCKSKKCEICEMAEGWILIENSASSFAAHSKAEVKVYKHAFVS